LVKYKKRDYRFPWREKNRFRLLENGNVYFPAMLEAIASARRYILLEMYLFETGEVATRFIEALRAAAERDVRVFLLVDDFGSFFLRGRDRSLLRKTGIETIYFNPLRFRRRLLNIPRNHRKLLLVDGVIAFTGGAGIADQFDPEVRPDNFWHEIMLEIRGSCVRDWQTLFSENWERCAGEPIGLPANSPPASLDKSSSGRLVFHNRFRKRSEIMRSVLAHIRNARSRIWISTAYFVPSWKLRRSLRRAARSGLDVRLLLPGPRTDNPAVRLLGRRYYEKIMRDGIRIFEYQPRFLHAKVFLIDDWISIGSSNLDHWNHRWNLEANQEVIDPEVLRDTEKLFAGNFILSNEIDYSRWLRRSWYQRFVEGFLGRILVWTTRIRERRPLFPGDGGNE